MKKIHSNKKIQLLLGLLTGIGFGFILHRSGVTKYDVIIGQLLLYDFTVLKVMLTAVMVGMWGVYALKKFNLATLHPKTGSFNSSVFGGLVFGLGFALLGYCPGTVAGAAGSGALDAILGGVPGILVGSFIFASLYHRMENFLNRNSFSKFTFPEIIGVNEWYLILPAELLLLMTLILIERAGL